MTDETPDLLATPEAAQLLGVPEAEFTRLAQVLNLTPARAGTRTTPRYWDRATIELLHHGPEGQELRESVSRKEQIRQIRKQLSEHYPEWRAALKPAADGLFNFNRYAKWAACSSLRRRELYDLKDGLIRLLYELGCCRGLAIHTAEFDELDCPDCEAAGVDWQGRTCPTCSGQGTLPEKGAREYLAFCFLIDGAWYNWHTPRAAVRWSYEPIEVPRDGRPEGDWRPKAGEKPVYLDVEEFLHAEALIKFVLRGRKDEAEAERTAEREQHREDMRRQGLARQAELRQQQAEQEGGTP